MRGCWDPEFEPSVEEIVDYPMISLWRSSQFAFSSELAFRAGGFPHSVEHIAGEGQPAQAARPNIEYCTRPSGKGRLRESTHLRIT